MKFPTIFLLIAGMTASAAENLIFNGSFELGTDGFAMQKNLNSSRNPKLEFFPLQVDSLQPGDGKYSLRLENPHGEHFELRSREFPMKPETEYVLRGMIRSDRPETHFRLLVLGINPKRKWLFHPFPLKAGKETLAVDFPNQNAKNCGAVVLFMVK